MLLGVAATYWVSRQQATRDPISSLAVLPFVNLGSAEEEEYFSDGLTEEVIGTLSRLQGLRVVARTSAFQFKGTNLDVREIGKRLNVQAVLEGSVRSSQGRVRIAAQLIDAGTGYHLWSRTYDRNLEDIIVTQEELSQAIANALECP